MQLLALRPLGFVRLFFSVCLSSSVLLAGCAGGGGGGNGSTTGSGSGTSTPAASLSVASVSPTNVPVGSSAVTLSVTGTGFTAGTVVSLNGTAETTTFVSATQVQAAVPAAQLTKGIVLQVAVANGSTTVTADTKTALSVDNPVPTFTSVSPSMVPVGSTAATVTVTGTNFVQGVALSVNGTPRSSTYVSATQFTSELTAADFSTASPLLLNVINPQPGGGASGTSSLAVNNPAPAIASINPRTIVAGSAGVTVAVTGTGFVPGTLVSVNGATRTSSYVNSSQMNVLLTTADFTNAGTLAITATNPAPGGGVSPTAAIFSVTAKPATGPSITQIAPATMYVGSNDSYLAVYGAGFATNTVVQWNGNALPTTYLNDYSGTYLIAKVASSLLTATGTVNITAYTSTAIVPTSNGLTLTIANPPVPTLTSLSTNVGPIGKDATVTLYGGGFTNSSAAYFNGTKLTPTAYTSSSLTITIPAASLLFPGVGNISVTTSAPGGGTSASLPFTAYIPIVSNSMIYNPTNGLLYLSIPSSVGAPYGNTIVSMDPATGARGTPIPVGSEPNKLALTADGKYLWVGLDGASAVRKVDLTTNTAGFQFALNPGSSTSSITTATALAALPGATDSVVVLQGYGYYGAPAIYDSGVLRGTVPTSNYYSQYALQVDGNRNEIYAGGSGLYTYTYNSSGVTTKTSNSNYSITLAGSSNDEMQLVSGNLYGDFGKVYDAEAGTLMGTMYVSGTSVAQGPTFYDGDLGKIFIVDNTSGYNYSGENQIQIFSATDYTASASSIPISVPYYVLDSSTGIYTYLSSTNRLTRWGTNGLAFHTNLGVFSLRSNLVKDVSSTIADLSVSLTASGGATTGSTTSYNFSVQNTGPSIATDVAMALQLPTTGVLTAATTSSGSCSTQTGGCSLGSIASGSTVTGTISILQTTAGTGTLTAQVTASTTDNNSANDRSSASMVITGDTYNLTPTLASISPMAIRSGSGDTVITVMGTNFTSGSTVMLGNAALATSFTSASTLTATVPSAKLASMGWASISVTSPAPGGGTSNTTPLSIYSVLSLAANHMIYDPYSRKLMTAVSTGSSAVDGPSIVAITPETATIGTPVKVTNAPTELVLSTSGQTLYAANSTASSLVRYNMLTGVAENIAIPIPSNYYYTPYAYGLAIAPDSENTLAISLGNYFYNTGIYDYSTGTKTLTERTNYSTNYYYNGTDCLRFPSNSYLFGDSGSALVSFGYDANGFTSTSGTTSSLNQFGCFKLAGSNAYAALGGVATLTASGGATQLGSFAISSYGYGYSNGTDPVEPDLSLKQVFFAGITGSSSLYGSTDGIVSFDSTTYVRNGALPLNIPTIEGTTSYSVPDLIRWGQDGLALMTSTGHIYLVRGPFVVPQLLNTNSAATLTASSASTVTHGAGNTLLTLTGSNFVPGVAVTWNGSYRTTTIVDATHVTVAIPASDLAAAGSGSLVATNPGAGASAALTITIQ